MCLKLFICLPAIHINNSKHIASFLIITQSSILMKYLSFIIGLFFSMSAFAQSTVGLWKSVDDLTGEARSHIDIYEQDGQLFGKVVKLLDASPDSVCDSCDGDKKNQPLIGMVIIENLKPYKDYWRKGKILDPESGNVYSCDIWLEDGALKVKGKHWTGLFRTQTWYRVE